MARARAPAGTPRLLRDLRLLRVVVLHPEDEDGDALLAQLRRIGCQVRAYWPPPRRLPDDAELVFFALRPETLSLAVGSLEREDGPPVICVVNYENPVIVEAVLRLNTYGVLASPVKSFGLLTSIAVAINLDTQARERTRYAGRLEQRLTAERKVGRAKAILMHTRGLSEDEAYRMIRNQAMSRRVTTADIAEALIQADALLAGTGLDGGEDA